VVLNYAAYLTVGGSLGRVWGVLDRRFLPWGEVTESRLPMGSWVYRWKDVARGEWAGVNDEQCAGASLFVEDPENWLRLAEGLSAEPGATWKFGADAAAMPEGEEGGHGESSG